MSEAAEQPSRSSKGKENELPQTLDDAQTLWEIIRQQLKKCPQLEEELSAYVKRKKRETYQAKTEDYSTIKSLEFLSTHCGRPSDDMLKLDRRTDEALEKDDFYTGKKREEIQSQTTLRDSWSALNKWKALPTLENISSKEKQLLGEVASAPFDGLLDHANKLIVLREDEDEDEYDYEGCQNPVVRTVRNLCLTSQSAEDDADICVSLILKFGEAAAYWSPGHNSIDADSETKITLDRRKDCFRLKYQVDQWLAKGQGHHWEELDRQDQRM